MNSHDPLAGFKDPALCRSLLDRIRAELITPVSFMEVCGTHTVTIFQSGLFQSGLRSLLPQEISHVSGPGCPVCITHEGEVAAFLELAGKNNVVIATFGDLMRVPGPGGRNLKAAQAEGARVESDCAGLGHLVARLLQAVPEIHVLSRPHQGGPGHHAQ